MNLRDLEEKDLVMDQSDHRLYRVCELGALTVTLTPYGKLENCNHTHLSRKEFEKADFIKVTP